MDSNFDQINASLIKREKNSQKKILKIDIALTSQSSIVNLRLGSYRISLIIVISIPLPQLIWYSTHYFSNHFLRDMITSFQIC